MEQSMSFPQSSGLLNYLLIKRALYSLCFKLLILQSPSQIFDQRLWKVKETVELTWFTPSALHMVKLKWREVKLLDQLRTLNRHLSQGQHPDPLWVLLLLCDSATNNLGGHFLSLQSELTAPLLTHDPHLPSKPLGAGTMPVLCILSSKTSCIWHILKKYFWKPLVNKSTANDLFVKKPLLGQQTHKLYLYCFF